MKRVHRSVALALTLCTGAAAAHEHAWFVFRLQGMPVGVVELECGDAELHYRSTHWLWRDGARDELRREAQLPLDARGHLRGQGRLPASLWIFHAAKGCAPVRDELSGQDGEACAHERRGNEVEGTLLGKAYRATYDAAGRLQHLLLGDAEFVRVENPPPRAEPSDVLGGSVSIQGQRGPLQLDPPGTPPTVSLTPWSEGPARALLERVRTSFIDAAPGEADLAADPTVGARGGCLAHARRYERWARSASGERRAAVIYGFYASSGSQRARAHAWVVVQTPRGVLSLDPALGVAVSPRTHLALGALGASGEAGQVLLDVVMGRRRIVRARGVSLE